MPLMVIDKRRWNRGDFEVGRGLPFAKRRMVGRSSTMVTASRSSRRRRISFLHSGFDNKGFILLPSAGAASNPMS